MNIDERLDLLTKIHLDQAQEFHGRFLLVEAQMAHTDAQMARNTLDVFRKYRA